MASYISTDQLGIQPVPNRTPWHPKLTPYRLLFLSTTISLGTAKAVVTQRGSTILPITLEWVLGTALFTVLFILGFYDSDDDVPPRFLAWMFEFDCMDVVWPLLAKLNIQRSQYASGERPANNIIAKHNVIPPLTVHRLLVSMIVICFGAAKATASYYGQTSAANWTDWILGVVATSLIYYLSLYERNSSDTWPSFYVYDRIFFLYSGMAPQYSVIAQGRGAETSLPAAGKGAMHILGACISMAWTAYWWETMLYWWHLFDSTPAAQDTNKSWNISIENIQNLALRMVLTEMCILALVVGVAYPLVLLRTVLRAIFPKRRFSLIINTILTKSGLASFLADDVMEKVTFVGMISVHIVAHIICMVLSATFSLGFFVFMTQVYAIVKMPEHWEIERGIFALIAGMVGLGSLTGLGYFFYFAWLLMSPLVMYLGTLGPIRRLYANFLNPT